MAKGWDGVMGGSRFNSQCEKKKKKKFTNQKQKNKRNQKVIHSLKPKLKRKIGANQPTLPKTYFLHHCPKKVLVFMVLGPIPPFWLLNLELISSLAIRVPQFVSLSHKTILRYSNAYRPQNTKRSNFLMATCWKHHIEYVSITKKYKNLIQV